MAGKDVDTLTGIETTGHEWDGIKELNTPLPKWWLWVFYATIVWALAYSIAFPSWPWLSGYFKGVLDYSSREEFGDRMAAFDASRAGLVRPHRRRFASGDQRRSAAPADRNRRRQGDLWQQLRTLPRHRRHRPSRRLSRAGRRRLDVGRHRGRYLHDHPSRRAQRRSGGALLGDAGLRRRTAC